MFNKSCFVFGFALLCGVSFASGKVIGSGKMASETRPTVGAHGVNLAGVGDLTITRGDKEELVVEAEDNIVPLIETTVDKDGILLIRFKNNEARPTKNITYKLTIPHLDRLALSGSGNINADRLDADRARISLPGSGDIAIARLEAGELGVALDGSGKVKLAAGTARRQTVEVAGAGTYAAEAINSSDAAVSISGSGDAVVRASETLDIKISGSGEVSYAGDPKVTRKISGSGEIKRL